MRQTVFQFLFIIFSCIISANLRAQTIEYWMPEETEPHEGTWIQWPHNDLYGPWYRGEVTPTFVAMVDALQEGEKVHIIAYNSSEQDFINNALIAAGVPLFNVDFHLYPTDDVWSRDNGPMFVYDENNALTILDWGFNGWGGDTPYTRCDVIPASISTDLDIPRIDLNAVVLEGGAIEHDGHGTMMATRSSVTHSSRNPNLTEAEIEDYLTTYMGITDFIWLDGVYGEDITDMHIDGFVKFANSTTIVTMNTTDLFYWLVSPTDMGIILSATNKDGVAYDIVTVPLTASNVTTATGTDLGYKGSYCNYYIGNEVVLVPTYNDPNDGTALDIIQGVYPNRTVVGIDVRNIYEYGGMVHCLTQQQPVEKFPTGGSEIKQDDVQLNQNVPNPFSASTTIAFEAEAGDNVRLEVFNALGQKVATLTAKTNQHYFSLEASDFEPGLYLYSLSINGESMGSRQMVVSD